MVTVETVYLFFYNIYIFYNFLVFLGAENTSKKDRLNHQIKKSRKYHRGRGCSCTKFWHIWWWNASTISFSPNQYEPSGEAAAQKQAINIWRNSPVPRTKQENITEGQKTLNTPPRGHSSNIQQTLPKPSRSSQPIPFVFMPEVVRPLPKPPLRKEKAEKPGIVQFTLTLRWKKRRKEHKNWLKQTQAKQIKKILNGEKSNRNTTKGKNSTTQQ